MATTTNTQTVDVWFKANAILEAAGLPQALFGEFSEALAYHTNPAKVRFAGKTPNPLDIAAFIHGERENKVRAMEAAELEAAYNEESPYLFAYLKREREWRWQS